MNPDNLPVAPDGWDKWYAPDGLYEVTQFAPVEGTTRLLTSKVAIVETLDEYEVKTPFGEFEAGNLSTVSKVLQNPTLMLDVDTDEDVFTLIQSTVERRKMLRQLENVSGIGDSIAERIVDRFGSDIPADVDKLSDVPYVGESKAQNVVEWLNDG